MIVSVLCDEIIRECNSIKSVLNNEVPDNEEDEKLKEIKQESLQTAVKHIVDLVDLIVTQCYKRANLDDVFFAGELDYKLGENEVLHPGDEEEVFKNGNT